MNSSELYSGQPEPPPEELSRRTFHVVPGIGDYTNIQEAIDAAPSFSHIYVASGLYTQPLFINKPGLIIEIQDEKSEAQLTCAKGPLVAISLGENETFTLKGFRLIHTAVPDKRAELLYNSEMYQEMCESSMSIENWIRAFRISRNMNCAIWADGGHITIENCHISLSSCKQPMPAVVCSSGKTHINKCHIKGHGEIPTVGVYLSDGGLHISNSKVYKHRGSAVVLNSKAKNDVLITRSQIIGNVNCGILCMGEDSSPVIERCKIAHNDGIGVKVCLYNTAKIKASEIKKNETGIEINNGDPFVFLNMIKENTCEGIKAIGDKEFRCDGKIMSNDIFENEYGIVCSGPSCFTRIEGNGMISSNKKAGIRVIEGAHVSIVRNEIYFNSEQGILLVNGSSAHIERNNIYSNTKANIGFGGSENCDTTIIENNIYKGFSEGIFQLEGGTSWIKRNHVYDNVDGIVILNSHPIMTMNLVYDNKRSGITVAGNSQPHVVDNEIFRNTAVGIIIRDASSGLYTRNTAFGNLVQMAIITKSRLNLKQIKLENNIKGELQLPLPRMCALL